MSKVTSKLQLTVPKAIADKYGIRPGDELDWVAAGDSIRPPQTAQGPPWRRGGRGRAAEIVSPDAGSPEGARSWPEKAQAFPCEGVPLEAP